MNRLDSMYREVILEHQKDPRNFGLLDNPDLKRDGYNPLCGDHIVLHLKLDEDKTKIKKCQFQGEGCSICMASASIMTEEVEGESLQNALVQIDDFRKLMKGEKDPAEFEGDLEALAGVRNFPVRIKCALLAWSALKDCIEDENIRSANSGGDHVTTTE